MIQSAEEFVALRTSENMEEYLRSDHEEAPIEVWRMVLSKYPEMKIWVAHNKTVPLEILAILADDSDPEVRWSVARKRKLSATLFAKLANDDDDSVRAAVAINKKTPAEVLKLLINDPWEEVRNQAKANLSRLGVPLPKRDMPSPDLDNREPPRV